MQQFESMTDNYYAQLFCKPQRDLLVSTGNVRFVLHCVTYKSKEW